MAKAKRISVNAWENIVKENYTPVVSVEWHGVELTIRRTLSLNETLAFIEHCAAACFRDNDSTYMPEKLSFAIKMCMVEMYTNVALPANIEKQYDLIYCSDLIEIIMQYIDRKQFDEMFRSINARVEYRASANIEMVNRRIDEMYSALENMEKQLESVLSGINSGDLKNILGAISTSGFDEEKLVKAYMAHRKAK